MGAVKQAKGRAGRRQRKQSPRRVSERHLNPASQEAKPPAGDRDGGSSQRRAGSAPGDARGEAPCIRKLKTPPFPPGRALCERGVGGMGAKRHCYGRQIRQPKKPAPRRCRERPLSQCRSRLKRRGAEGEAPPRTGQAPAGCLPRRLNQYRLGSAPGMQGAKPPHTGQAPAGHLPRRLNQCRPGSTPGMQGAKPLA